MGFANDTRSAITGTVTDTVQRLRDSTNAVINTTRDATDRFFNGVACSLWMMIEGSRCSVDYTSASSSGSSASDKAGHKADTCLRLHVFARCFSRWCCASLGDSACPLLRQRKLAEVHAGAYLLCLHPYFDLAGVSVRELGRNETLKNTTDVAAGLIKQLLPNVANSTIFAPSDEVCFLRAGHEGGRGRKGGGGGGGEVR